MLVNDQPLICYNIITAHAHNLTVMILRYIIIIMTKSMHLKHATAEKQTHKSIEQWPHNERRLSIVRHRTIVENT